MTHCTLETQQAAARAQLCPSDLDLAINVLTKLLDQQGEDATIATHTRVRKGLITRIDFSTREEPFADITDLAELDNNTALAWIRVKQNKVQQDNDTCNEHSGVSQWLRYLEYYFGNYRKRRLQALIGD